VYGGAKLDMGRCAAAGYQRIEEATGDVRVQRHLLALATPPDPLTPAERQAVRDTAAALLAQDPQQVGISLRDPRGYPGYPAGANHISYLLPDGTRHTDDIVDEPGVRAWLRAVQEAADNEHRRIDYDGDPWNHPAQARARLEAAGYTVADGQYGRVTCRHQEHALSPRVSSY
jgi:hypothetical protein